MRPPVVVLVRPQLAENIGMTARAMANFGLAELRLVAPREGWPKKGAHQAASGATHVLAAATLHDTVEAAVADLGYVVATSARARGQMKRVLDPAPALADLAARAGRGEACGVLFGPERAGLDNDAVALADALVTFPVDPAFASLNLAQAVLLVAYEWRRASAPVTDAAPATDAVPVTTAIPGAEAPPPPPARRASLLAFLESLEGLLDGLGHYPPDKRPVMVRNMRDMVLRMAPTEQDVRTLRGVLRALTRRPRA